VQVILWPILCRFLKISQVFTSAYHPQTNGMVERSNAVIGAAMATLAHSHLDKWDLYLPYIAFMMRTSGNRTTGYSPFFAIYGRDALMPLDTIFDVPPSQLVSSPQYTQIVIERLKATHQEINEKLSSVSHPELHTKSQPAPFKVGDKVYVYSPQYRKGLSQKFVPQWKGPFTVTKIIIPLVLYQIQITSHKHSHIHVQRLKRAISRQAPSSSSKALMPSAPPSLPLIVE
jgi:hypothetical protein